jgi:histidyl-tRNA synthetase
MIGKFIGQQVPAVGFSIGFERICDILLDQGFQVPEQKQKMALLYVKDADFGAVMKKSAALRENYAVTILPQAKKLGKQLGTLEAQGFGYVAFADNEDIKVLGQN